MRFTLQNILKRRNKTVYPGLKSHPSHDLYAGMINSEYGFGGMMTLDVGSLAKANALMELMQSRNLGYLAVSLGFYKTLFSAREPLLRAKFL
jgi:methionine-gamma-lyase